MSKILTLKNRKRVIDTIHRASCAMKAAASVGIHKTQQQIKTFNSTNAIINENDQIILQTMFDQEHNIEKTTTILISANKGMCGDFTSKLTKYFKANSEKQDFWFLFGTKMEKYTNKKNIYYSKETMPKEQSLLTQTNNIIEHCKKNKITHLKIAYTFEQKIVEKTIYSKLDSKNKLKPSTKKENLPSEFATFFLANKIYDAMLKSALEENKQRVIAMTQAKNNAEEIGKAVLRLCNRARQEKITFELNEITAGIL